MRSEADAVGQLHRTAAVELGVAGHVQGPAAQRAVAAHGQAAGVEHGAATVGVGTVEGQVGRTVLDQAAIADDQTIEGQVLSTAEGQLRTQAEVVGQLQRAAAVELGVAGDAEHAAAQRCVVAQGEAAGVDQGATAQGVDAVEGEVACTVLDQQAGAGNHAVEGQVLVAGEGQLRAEADVVGQLQRAEIAEPGIAGDAQGTAAQRAVVA